MHLLQAVVWFLDVIVFSYFILYCVINLLLLVISTFQVRRALHINQVFDGASQSSEAFAPLISLVVPAYNEDVTIEQSVHSLLRLNYPRYEIILVNDGSKDNTVEVLKKAFDFIRSDVDYNPHLGTSKVRGFYRSRISLPPAVERLVLVDKENGGKADAINAGLNASRGTYVATMDADSLLVDQSLYSTIQPILDDPNRVMACGGQVALSNGCRVEDGHLVETALPKKWIARFQVVEYMRSFTQGRVALGQLNLLLILSGVFALFQRETLLAIGGFLTKHMRSRIGREYCGVGSETVCEDMEVVVRLHRYLQEHKIDGTVVFLPFPTAYSEAPEVWRNLGKQRNRWYRGLLEVLWIHRGMMFNPRYKWIGLFSLPYQFFFEALAPIIECIGYLMIPLSIISGILSLPAMASFVALALTFSLFLSTGSVLLAIWRFRAPGQSKDSALLQYKGLWTLAVMVGAGLVSNLGYRQYLIYWQLRGLKDFLAGRKSWDKFARKGFEVKPQ